MQTWATHAHTLQHVGLTGGGCSDFHAAPRSVFAAVEGGGGNRGGPERTRHVEANLCFKLVDPDPPSPARHVTSPLSARSTQLRSPICLSDTLPLCHRRF